MWVLVVGDDATGTAVQATLRDALYAADWVCNGQTALDTAACQHST